MNIDWSKAPEGATHWDFGMHNRVAGWMKLDDGVWYWWPSKDAACAMKWHASLNQHMIKTDGFVERPAPWTGEGLPPVGKATCEYLGAHQYDIWTVVNIFAHWGDQVFVDYGDGWRAERDLARFRPIRTAEQIAEEARIAELNLMVGAIKDYPGGRHGVDHLTQLRIHEEVCIDLYDAGWRKQVAP